MESQRRDPVNRQHGVTEAQMSAFCDCFANGLANRMSADEIVHYAKHNQPSDVTKQKMQELNPTCIQMARGQRP